MHTPLRHPHPGEQAPHGGLAAHEEQVQEERCHSSGSLRQGPVELLLQEAAARRRGRRGASAGHGSTESPAGRVKQAAGSQTASWRGHRGCPSAAGWVPGWARWRQHLDSPLPGSHVPTVPELPSWGWVSPSRRVLCRGAPRTSHPAQGSGGTRGTLRGTPLGALSREGTVTPIT